MEENTNSTAFEQLKQQFRTFIKEQCGDIMGDTFKELAKEYIAEEWGKVLDIPLTMQQVADLMEVSVKTVYKWRERNIIPFYRRHGKLSCNFRDLYKILLDKKSLIGRNN